MGLYSLWRLVLTLLMSRCRLTELLLWLLRLLRDVLLLGKLLRQGMLLYQRRASVELTLLCCVLCRTEAGCEPLGVGLKLWGFWQTCLLDTRLPHLWL